MISSTRRPALIATLAESPHLPLPSRGGGSGSSFGRPSFRGREQPGSGILGILLVLDDREAILIDNAPADEHRRNPVNDIRIWICIEVTAQRHSNIFNETIPSEESAQNLVVSPTTRDIRDNFAPIPARSLGNGGIAPFLHNGQLIFGHNQGRPPPMPATSRARDGKLLRHPAIRDLGSSQNTSHRPILGPVNHVVVQPIDVGAIQRINQRATIHRLTAHRTSIAEDGKLVIVARAMPTSRLTVREGHMVIQGSTNTEDLPGQVVRNDLGTTGLTDVERVLARTPGHKPPFAHGTDAPPLRTEAGRNVNTVRRNAIGIVGEPILPHAVGPLDERILILLNVGITIPDQGTVLDGFRVALNIPGFFVNVVDHLATSLSTAVRALPGTLTRHLGVSPILERGLAGCQASIVFAISISLRSAARCSAASAAR